MQILIVNLRVKREKLDAFRTATLENARNSIQEPGIARFDLLQDAEDPTHFVLYEVYRNADAPARHRETEHYKKWAAIAPDFLEEPRTRVFYSNVFPPDSEW